VPNGVGATTTEMITTTAGKRFLFFLEAANV
jgi:hypothetical protein